MIILCERVHLKKNGEKMNEGIPVDNENMNIYSGLWKICLSILVIIILIVVVSSCVTVVETSKVAVVTTFGSITGVAKTGLHFKLPWQVYNIIDLSVQTDTGEYATATKDSQAVSQEVTIRWEVEPDMATALFERYLGNHKEKLFDAVKGDSVKEGSATLSLSEYIPKREELRTAMKSSLNQQLSGQGIRIVGVEIANIVLPEGFEKAIADRQVAEEKKKTASINQETALIDAETNRILAESYQKPEFFKIEWLKKWNGSLPNTLVIGDESATTVFPLQ
jgi:regulator of protease activity HflC (stomatin/prohibitin superfamily)